MSRARLGVRRRYRDDVRLDFAYPKMVWHPVSRARLGVHCRYRDDVRLDFAYTKHSGSLLFPFHFEKYIKGCLSSPRPKP